MSIRWSFILALLLGMTLMLIMMAFFYQEVTRQEQTLKNIIHNDLSAAQLYTNISNQLAVNHARIYQLLDSAEKGDEEGNVYDAGKELLLEIHDLEAIVLESEIEGLLELQQKIDPKSFYSRFKNYKYNASNAIIMATVDLDLSSEKMAEITGTFNLLNADLLYLTRNQEKAFHKKLTEHRYKNNRMTRIFSIFFLVTFISIMSLTILFSHYLSKRLQSYVNRLHELTVKKKNKKTTSKNEIVILDQVIDQVKIDHHILVEMQQALKNHQINLEKTIQERTEEINRNYEEIKTHSDKITQAKLRAEQASKAKSDFLAMMSHEIRTPMNAIIGFSQLLEMSEHLSAEDKDNLKVLQNSGNHLLVLINDILEMSKIEAGCTEINLETVDIHELITDMESMFRLPCKEHKMQLLVKPRKNLPRWIKVDGRKLRQIIINILGNATKFTKKGSITLSADIEKNNSGSDRLIIIIEDTGPGIAKEEYSKIFEKFRQTQTGESSSQGTGLGLALSKGFAQLLDGDITFTSEPGIGSAFRIEISAQVTQKEFEETTQDGNEITAADFNKHNFNILLVDDVETNLLLLTRIISLLGITTREAHNGEEAINMIKSTDFDLVIMDLNMPVMDGYEAIKNIRSIQKSDVPIIAASASMFESDKNRVLACGASSFLRKPFRKNEIHRLLSQYLSPETQIK